MVGEAGTSFTVNVATLEVLVSGFWTETNTLPALAIKVAGTTAASWVELTNPVDRLCGPLPVSHWTTDPLTKFVPLTNNWKEAPPAPADDGFKPPETAIVGQACLVLVGFGFLFLLLAWWRLKLE